MLLMFCTSQDTTHNVYSIQYRVYNTCKVRFRYISQHKTRQNYPVLEFGIVEQLTKDQAFTLILFYFISLAKLIKNKLFFTMTAYPGQTWTTLGQLCATLWDSQLWPGCDTAWNRTRVSVVTPISLRCSALDR
jgi:hypothetical protein